MKAHEHNDKILNGRDIYPDLSEMHKLMSEMDTILHNSISLDIYRIISKHIFSHIDFVISPVRISILQHTHLKDI